MHEGSGQAGLRCGGGSGFIRVPSTAIVRKPNPAAKPKA